MRLHTTVLLGLLGISALVVGCGESPPQSGDPSTTTGDPAVATPAPPRSPDFILAPEAFYDEVIDSPTKASAKYRDKVVEVTGKVSLFQRDPLDRNGPPSVTVGELPRAVVCTTLAKEPWLKCTYGQTIKIRGTVGNLLGAVSINDCEFTVVSGDPAADLTVEQLLADFAANEVDAKKKYGGMAVLLSGEFVSMEKGGITGYFVDLKGDGKRRIVCKTAMGDGPWLEMLKPGEPVTLSGELQVIGQINLLGAVLTRASVLPE